MATTKRTLTLLALLAGLLAAPARPAAAASWKLVGWNNLGMHCMDADFSVSSLLPAYNTFHARRAIEEDGAEVVILGGGPLVGYGKEIEQDLGIPVVDPTLAAFKMMEGFVDQGWRHSKIGRWSPPLDTLGDASGAIPYNRKWLDLP